MTDIDQVRGYAYLSTGTARDAGTGRTFTAYLYARPSFFEGIARILDFSNTLNEYNRSLSDEQADGIALGLDWAGVAHALRSSMQQSIPSACQ